MTAFERVLEALEPYRVWSSSWGETKTYRCPAHDDRRPSLRVSPPKDDWGVALYCQAGCDIRQIVSALGLTMSDLFEGAVEVESSSPRPKRRLVYAVLPPRFWPREPEPDPALPVGMDPATLDWTREEIAHFDRLLREGPPW